MNSLEGEIIEAYKAACRSFQLSAPCVLQDFTKALCVPSYLAADTGTVSHSATQVFSAFVESYSPVFPLNPIKRMRGIRYLRTIVKVNRSFRSEEEKEIVYKQICNQWFVANDIQGEGKNLWLHDRLSVNLSKGFLLLCDLFRCRPLDLLHYFMEEVVLEMARSTTDGPAITFLLHCVTRLYPIQNN